ncbi:hypothetical protein Vc3S01_1662 [Vibrio campbellii]|nr:hypothetical protein Vc3S01_1662 [Vibrio campbellii]
MLLTSITMSSQHLQERFNSLEKVYPEAESLSFCQSTIFRMT